MISKTGHVVVRIESRFDRYIRREDGSQTELFSEPRFDNHNKMVITGTVQVGTQLPDVNPVEDRDRLMPRCHHYPTGYVFGDVFSVDLREGDEVWFHYLCAEDTSQMERNRDGSWNVFMQVSDIFCYVRNGKMRMNQNWIWGDEVKDTSIVPVSAMGYEKRAAMLTPAGGIEIIPGVAIAPYVDEARILHIDYCRYRSVHKEVSPLRRVYLAKDAGFPNVIRGHKGLLFRHTDVLAIHNTPISEVIPVGSNHLVKVLESEYKSVFDPATGKRTLHAPEWGKITASGAQCKEGKPGDKIIFSRRWCRPLNKTYYLVEDGEIQAKII